MIFGIGTDITSVERFRRAREGVFERILSEKDKEYLEKFKEKSEHVAGFWAAKEALVKALNRKDLEFRDISILHDENGKPFFSFEPEKGNIHLSISHEKEYAVAFVVWSD